MSITTVEELRAAIAQLGALNAGIEAKELTVVESDDLLFEVVEAVVSALVEDGADWSDVYPVIGDEADWALGWYFRALAQSQDSEKVASHNLRNRLKALAVSHGHKYED